MVNVDRLLKLLGEDYYIDNDGDIIMNGSVVWFGDELQRATSRIQVIGYAADKFVPQIYDEIYSKLNDSIFEVDKEKVESNLKKLGLIGKIDKIGDYDMYDGGMIKQKNFIYVERMDYIPSEEVYLAGERIYNNILKASKEWK